MQYRKMGKTGLELSILSYGSWVTFSKQIDETKADHLMSIAYDQGVNFFDNAEVYALGESERIMGNILSKKNWDRSSYVVSSKAFFGWRGKENKPNQTGLSRKHLFEACHEALIRLQLDYLDLFYCHRPDRTTPIEEVVWTMNHLIQQGKILYWGTSEWTGAEIMEAHMVAKSLNLIGPSVEQPQYNMFERQKMEQDYVSIFKNIGLGTTIWSPLSSGLLTGKYNNGIPEGSRLAMEGFEWLRDKTLSDARIQKVQALADLARNHDMSIAQMAIAWCLYNPNVTTAILGATTEQQLMENLSALNALEKMSPSLVEEIDEVLQNKPVYA